jgi:hypothetical protein
MTSTTETRALDLTENQAVLLNVILDHKLEELRQQHDASYSGTDQLLINSAIISVTELRDRVRAIASAPVPSLEDYSPGI